MIVLFGIISLLLPQSSTTQGCCSHVRRNQHDCMTVCERLEMAYGLTETVHALVPVTEHCPTTMTRLWRCINNTYPVLEEMDTWPGRLCCDLTSSRSCRVACNRARSENDLYSRCPQNDEQFFYQCISRQSLSETCCSNTINFQCKTSCRAIFASDLPPTTEMKQDVQNLCGTVSPSVTHCVNNYTQPTQSSNAAESLPCCEKADNRRCRDICRDVLVSGKSESEIMEILVSACSEVSPNDGGLWQCFILTSDRNAREPDPEPVHTIDTVGIDSAKLQCCIHAKGRRCQELCVQTYSSQFTATWSELDSACLQNPVESRMKDCLDSLDTPCQVGCSGLSYCSNFNSRPSEYFRGCNVQMDMDAENLLNSEGIISYLKASVSDAECNEDFWKALTCTYYLKPCHRRTMESHICRSDCMRILTKCVDNLPEGMTVDIICDQLGATGTNNSCISPSYYLKESHQKPQQVAEVSHPCSPSPCNASQICEVNRKKCRRGRRCKPYVCKSGCTVGEASTTRVPHGTHVLIPNPNSQHVQLNCHKICHCGHRGILGNCVDVDCVRPDSCLVDDSGQIYAHEKFTARSVCQQCVCFSKEMICTTRNCLEPGASPERAAQHTALPCDCPDMYNPVCAIHGQTFGSACLARCAGVPDELFEYGSCHDTDPCFNNPCGPGRKCIPRRQVCLSDQQTYCPQHECVSMNNECNRRHHDPVCDSRGDEHRSLCHLIAANRKFAHHGHCLTTCKQLGVVCGHNGETYPNECAAWAERVAMDYAGPCQAVGRISNNSKDSECSHITCPSVRPADCHAITPPGACCPICAAELRVMYSRTLADRISMTVSRGPLTVQNITEKIRHHIFVSECDVFGYLSTETDIVILVKTVSSRPTNLQVEVCNAEAHRLAAMIRARHPSMMSDLILSPLIMAPENAPGSAKVSPLRTSLIVQRIVVPSPASGVQIVSPCRTLLSLIVTCSWLLLR